MKVNKLYVYWRKFEWIENKIKQVMNVWGHSSSWVAYSEYDDWIAATSSAIYIHIGEKNQVYVCMYVFMS